MISAICFGAVFGFPFILWGLFLIFDRDRTWQHILAKSKSNTPPKRTRAWDIRQQIYGTLMVIIGTLILLGLTILNFAAQQISPPSSM